MAETEEELKRLLIRGTEEKEKKKIYIYHLKLNIHKTKIMAFSPVTS